MIKHIWFDFSETLASLKKESHDNLRYETYSKAVKKPISKELIEEYEALYRKNHNSNAAVFRSLGFPSEYWSNALNSVNSEELYELTDVSVPRVLKKIKNKVPISLFSNLQTEKILPIINIDPKWFKFIIGPKMVKEPKPALEGFYKMIELSDLPTHEILYIGDDVKKDVLPAKEVGIKAGILWKSSKQADYSFEKFEDILDVVD